jgi:pimeloyl-ACP methyl ester carboxylesterase
LSRPGSTDALDGSEATAAPFVVTRGEYGPHVPRITPLAASLLVALASLSCAKESDRADLGTGVYACAGDDGTSDNGNGAAEAGSIDWSECGPDLECAEIDVPLDYDDPDGDTITLSVGRSPATGDRIGALFVNPGGPGATASDFAGAMASILPSAITERFDIVGVDPRGTGSSAIDCGGDFFEIYGLDYSIDSPEDTTELLDVSQDYVDGCGSAVGDELPHLGTRDVAHDIDTVRELMGDDQISYLGFSYGTAIGQVYAEEFPGNVRAMVLDGVLELGPTGTELAEEQALGFEKALDSFVDDCNADSTCPLAPDAEGAIEELTEMVEEDPIPGGSRDLGPGELNVGVGMALYSQSLWGDLANGVEAALDGDGSGIVSLADQYIGIGSFDVYFAVNCLDFEWPGSPEELLADGAATKDDAPHFGEYIVNDYVRCAMWPVESEPLTQVTAPGTPPILVVSTTNDPATPYEAGVHVAENLESGVLLTYEGDGHTVVGNGVTCVDDIVVTYLLDVEPPEDETTC